MFLAAHPADAEHNPQDRLSVLADDAKAVAAGLEHSMVLKTDGTVWATGENMAGQLGDGSWRGTSKFVKVIGIIY